MTTPAFDSLFDIRDRVVVVTGASSGIGRMLAHGLTAVGAKVVLAARRENRLRDLVAEIAKEIGEDGRAVPVACDISDDAGRARLVDQAVREFGGIDGLVNNAGISGSGLPATRQSTAEFREVLEVDLVAPFDLAKRCLVSMRERGGGSIVNVTSTAAVTTTGTGIPQAAYCAAKAGLAHLTRELAVQWGRYLVRVNAFAPGFFATEMTELMTDADGMPPDWLTVRQAIKGSAGAADALGTVQFLLSDASRFVTGQHIVVDGGQTIT
ncbi:MULTISPECIES: SDR family oxidoreductase [unclassified Frankia]|uniref:SDR family NAD(P)-dependent oxidoreductase n=1 Tax=unclassified Frankia TaxID=2632575 RepID=UPI002AD30F0F|nr:MULTISPECIES: SDR family oxidoreductase [unclassified Frankia]